MQLFLLGDDFIDATNPADTSTRTDPTEESWSQTCFIS
jgi:hypothetical protein